jgi:hypothetical protein
MPIKVLDGRQISVCWERKIPHVSYNFWIKIMKSQSINKTLQRLLKLLKNGWNSIHQLSRYQMIKFPKNTILPIFLDLILLFQKIVNLKIREFVDLVIRCLLFRLLKLDWGLNTAKIIFLLLVFSRPWVATFSMKVAQEDGLIWTATSWNMLIWSLKNAPHINKRQKHLLKVAEIMNNVNQ